jgi:hypothetical protein
MRRALTNAAEGPASENQAGCGKRRRLKVMRRYLFPNLSLAQAAWMLAFGAVCSVIAGLYGVLHDQLTFWMSPEYFTKFKVYQFGYEGEVDPGPWVAGKIGFQATWWVGMFAGWFWGRLALPKTSPREAAALCLRAVIGMMSVTLAFGLGGWAWAQWRLDDAGVRWWAAALRGFDVSDVRAFAAVGYIHNGSYLGALAGLILEGMRVRRRCSKEGR